MQMIGQRNPTENDMSLEDWKQDAAERTQRLRWPKHRVRTIGSRSEDELFAIAYDIRCKVQEAIASGKMQFPPIQGPRKECWEVFDLGDDENV